MAFAHEASADQADANLFHMRSPIPKIERSFQKTACIDTLNLVMLEGR
jgi:hypothetical protein